MFRSREKRPHTACQVFFVCMWVICLLICLFIYLVCNVNNIFNEHFRLMAIISVFGCTYNCVCIHLSREREHIKYGHILYANILSY